MGKRRLWPVQGGSAPKSLSFSGFLFFFCFQHLPLKHQRDDLARSFTSFYLLHPFQQIIYIIDHYSTFRHIPSYSIIFQLYMLRVFSYSKILQVSLCKQCLMMPMQFLIVSRVWDAVIGMEPGTTSVAAPSHSNASCPAGGFKKNLQEDLSYDFIWFYIYIYIL